MEVEEAGGEMANTGKDEAEAEYHSHDFEWEELKEEVESGPAFSYHLSPFLDPAASTTLPPQPSSEAWRSFHRRHASGKFFKVASRPPAQVPFLFLHSCLFDQEFRTSSRSRNRKQNVPFSLVCARIRVGPWSLTCGELTKSTKMFGWEMIARKRRYLLKEFPELCSSKDHAKVLEVGCGNGSTAVSILRSSERITVFACDCSKDTLEKANEIISNTKGIDIKDRFHPFLMDVSKETFPDWLFCKACQSSLGKAAAFLLDPSHHGIRKERPVFLRENQCCVGRMDFITMIFTLSAIPFHIMPTTIEQCASVLKPGGLLLFRDYGLYDMTMLRFLPHQRVGFREYMRSDGTFSYFFSLDTVRELFHAAGLVELELEYCCVKSVNRKNGKAMQRVWVHGKFQKPPS